MFATRLTAGAYFLSLFAMSAIPRISLAQVDLAGKWNVDCAVEKISEDAVTVCDICPKVASTKSALSIGDLNFVFTKDSMTISKEQENKKSTVKYTLLEQLQILIFNYEGTAYKFRILTTETNEFILKEETSGCSLEMKKVLKK